jgi:hypothetical protein
VVFFACLGTTNRARAPGPGRYRYTLAGAAAAAFLGAACRFRTLTLTRGCVTRSAPRRGGSCGAGRSRH